MEKKHKDTEEKSTNTVSIIIIIVNFITILVNIFLLLSL